MKRKMAGLLIIMAFVCVGIAACKGEDANLDSTSSTSEPTSNISDDTISSSSDAQSEDSDVQEITASAEDVDKVTQLIDVKSVPTLDDSVCVFITNNSDTVIDELEVKTDFLDADGQIIDLDEDWQDMILPGYTVVSEMDAPDTYNNYETTFSIELGVNPSYENHSENVDISANSGDDCVIVQITNNDSVEIEEIEYIVVFYKGDSIASVSYAEDVYDVPAGETVTEKVDARKINYDDFKVYLNQAHTFGL